MNAAQSSTGDACVMYDSCQRGLTRGLP